MNILKITFIIVVIIFISSLVVLMLCLHPTLFSRKHKLDISNKALATQIVTGVLLVIILLISLDLNICLF